ANTSLTVGGTVTVGNSVTIANSSLNMTVIGNNFTSDSAPLTNVQGTDVIFADKNISTLRTATMFINNTGTAPITVSLQLSPDGTFYMNDPSHDNVVVPNGEGAYIVIDTFAQYAQLQYNLGTTIASFIAYFNGQA
ncbi:DUF6385 domain-containing protein, partial [Hydrogenoanaerobacterium saccharovorans]